MFRNFRKDFPLFDENRDLIYLDSASTSQKPSSVIDTVDTYLKTSNSNIHRGSYDIADRSESLYRESKKAYARLIGAQENEIIYTYNATYAFNMVAQSCEFSSMLKEGDVILLPMREHHANVVPWQMIAHRTGSIIEFVKITDSYDIDRDNFAEKYTDKVKVVSLSVCSNSTGSIINVQKAKKIIHESTLLVVDGSQLVGKRAIDVKEWGCDIMIATAHKVYGLTGLGMIYMRSGLIRKMVAPWGGGAMISDVSVSGFERKVNREGREAGTPHIVGAVSLLASMKYIQQVGIQEITKHDNYLTEYFLDKRKKSNIQGFSLIGKKSIEDRIGIFSLVSEDEKKNLTRLGEELAQKNIAIRTGGHCTHPYWQSLGHSGSLRVSLGMFNTTDDIDYFFEVFQALI